MADSKARILVAFYSRDGSVEALAKAIVEGAREAGAEVRLRRVPDIVSAEAMAQVPGWQEGSKRMWNAALSAARQKSASNPGSRPESYRSGRGCGLRETT